MTLVVAWAVGALSLSLLVIMSLLISCADVLFDVANATYLPAIVSEEELESRNSLLSGTHALSSIGGPALGGAISSIVGPILALAVVGFGYVTSALIFASTPRVISRRYLGTEAFIL